MWIQKVGGELQALVFSPDSRTLYAGSSGNRIDAWDVVARTGRRLSTADDLDYGRAFAVSPDGHHLILSTSAALVVQDAATDAVVSRTEWPAYYRYGTTRFSHDGRYVFRFPWTPTLLRWDWTTGAIPEELTWRWPKGLRIPVEFALHPDGRTLAVGEMGPAVIMFDVTTGEELIRLSEPLTPKKVLAFTPAGGHFVVFSEGGTLTVFEWPSGRPIWTKKPGGQVEYVRELVFHPSKPIVAYPTAKPPKRWPSVAWFGDMNTGEPLPMPHPGFESAVAVAFSPDGLTCAVAGSNRQFAVFDVDV